jgi:hypothetical protein
MLLLLLCHPQVRPLCSNTPVDKKRNFEVIVGKSTLSVGEGEEDEILWHKRFGFVQTYDDAKPKRRLHEVLHA